MKVQFDQSKSGVNFDTCIPRLRRPNVRPGAPSNTSSQLDNFKQLSKKSRNGAERGFGIDRKGKPLRTYLRRAWKFNFVWYLGPLSQSGVTEDDSAGVADLEAGTVLNWGFCTLADKTTRRTYIKLNEQFSLVPPIYLPHILVFADEEVVRCPQISCVFH